MSKDLEKISSATLLQPQETGQSSRQLAKRCTGEEMSSRKKKTQGTLIGSKYMRIFFLSFHLKTAYQKSLQKLTVWIG